jgi:hypothetical protein
VMNLLTPFADIVKDDRAIQFRLHGRHGKVSRQVEGVLVCHLTELKTVSIIG